MELLLFWIKITVKRILNLFISSPLTIIWVMIIITSFIYAFTNRHIVIMPYIRIIENKEVRDIGSLERLFLNNLPQNVLSINI